jgi:hypothetical protein
MRGKEVVFSSPKLKSKAQEELCFFKGKYMNDLKPEVENVEPIAEVPELEYAGPEFDGGEEEYQDEIRRFELRAKVAASIRRCTILLGIPFVRARVFSVATRPLFEGWDDQAAEVGDAEPDYDVNNDPGRFH